MAHTGHRAIFVSCDTGSKIDKLVESETKRTGYKVTIRGLVERAIRELETKAAKR